MIVTIDQVISWKPCGLRDVDDGENYTPQRITRLFAGRESLTARDVVALDIPRKDVVWALLHSEFLTDEQMHFLACDFAESVVHLCGDDPRPQAAIDAKRSWLRGEISDDELSAARIAAWDAAGGTAGGAAGGAAWSASWDAAWSASWAASWAATWDAQIKMIMAAINNEHRS